MAVRFRILATIFLFWVGFFVAARVGHLVYHNLGPALGIGGVLRAFWAGARLDLSGAAYLSTVPLIALAAASFRPLIRISVQGEVTRAGFVAVPVDAPLADVVTAAGGFTREANVDKLRIERDGDRVWEGKLQQVLTAGRTVDDARLRDGDQLVVPRKGRGTVAEGLRSAWFVVSITGGLIALTQVLR